MFQLNYARAQSCNSVVTIVAMQYAYPGMFRYKLFRINTTDMIILFIC